MHIARRFAYIIASIYSINEFPCIIKFRLGYSGYYYPWYKKYPFIKHPYVAYFNYLISIHTLKKNEIHICNDYFRKVFVIKSLIPLTIINDCHRVWRASCPRSMVFKVHQRIVLAKGEMLHSLNPYFSNAVKVIYPCCW